MTIEKVIEIIKENRRYQQQEFERIASMNDMAGKTIYGSIKSFKNAKTIWAHKINVLDDLLSQIIRENKLCQTNN